MYSLLFAVMFMAEPPIGPALPLPIQDDPGLKIDPAHTWVAMMYLTTPMPKDYAYGIKAFCPVDDSDYQPMMDALRRLCIDMELLDHRETRYVFARKDDFYDNLELMQRRYESLKDAPPLADHFRFPDHRTSNELLGFNRAYRRFLDARLSIDFDRADSIRQALKETDVLYSVWDHVRDARCEYYYVCVRRAALKKLKCMLGDEDYYKAELPPFVPIWRFHEE